MPNEAPGVTPNPKTPLVNGPLVGTRAIVSGWVRVVLRKGRSSDQFCSLHEGGLSFERVSDSHSSWALRTRHTPMTFGIVYMPGINRRLFALTMCTTPCARGFAMRGCFTKNPAS